jgi:hypothetical protein
MIPKDHIDDAKDDSKDDSNRNCSPEGIFKFLFQVLAYSVIHD